jgi:hypothetical protein
LTGFFAAFLTGFFANFPEVFLARFIATVKKSQSCAMVSSAKGPPNRHHGNLGKTRLIISPSAVLSRSRSLISLLLSALVDRAQHNRKTALLDDPLLSRS